MARSILQITVLLFLISVTQVYAEVIPLGTFGIASAPLLSPGSPTAWQDSDGNDLEIFWSDGISTSQITYNDADDSFPHWSGGMIVWQGWDGNDWEIFRFDGESTTQITFNEVDDISARIKGALIEWQGWDGNDWEIFRSDGTSTTQVTDNDVNDRILYPLELGGPPPGSIGVPEPSTIALALLATLAFSRRRRKY